MLWLSFLVIKISEIRDVFDAKGQLDSIALEVQSNPDLPARRGWNHFEFFGRKVSTFSKFTYLSKKRSPTFSFRRGDNIGTRLRHHP